MDEEKTGRGAGDAQQRKRDLASVRRAIAALRDTTGIPVTIGGVVGEGHTLVLSESLGMRTSAMKDLKKSGVIESVFVVRARAKGIAK